jgi:HNH endonuclease
MLNKSRSTPQTRPTPDFWELLQIFWDDDRIARWKNKIFPDPQNPDTGVESCFNLICLNSYAHQVWNSGFFALKPLELSADKKTFTLQFFWQPQYEHQRNDRIDLLKQPLSSEGLSHIGDTFLTYRQDNSPRDIQSGDTFTLTTDDPEIRPLPSLELLEMQWVLQRITAMSGASGTPNTYLNDDDDMSSGPTLIPDDYNTVASFEQVYKWIPPPPLQGSG